MSDEIRFGDTPIFDLLVREMRDRGTPFEGMISGGEKTLRQDKVTWEVSPLATKALTGLIRARDICTEMLTGDLPVILNEDLVRAESFATNKEEIMEEKREAGHPIRFDHLVQADTLNDYVGDAKELIASVFRGMYENAVSKYRFVVFDDINIKRENLFKTEFDEGFKVVRIEATGFWFEDGIPERYSGWTLDGMLESVTVPGTTKEAPQVYSRVRYSESAEEFVDVHYTSYLEGHVKFEVAEEFDPLKLTAKSDMFTAIVSMFRKYKQNNPGAIAKEISVDTDPDLASPGMIRLKIRGTDYTDGIPSDLNDWCIERAVADMLYPHSEYKMAVTPAEVADHQLQIYKEFAGIGSMTPKSRTSHLMELAKTAEEYLGVDGAVKAVRESSILVGLEKPIQGLEGIRPKMMFMDECNPTHAEIINNVADKLLENLQRRHPDAVEFRNIELVENADGSVDITGEKLTALTGENAIGEDLPDSMYMRGPVWGPEEE